jgi:hypothetical protein
MLDRMLLKQGGETVTIGDVFSTSLYTGNGGSQNVTNGIKLNSKGGLVWLKQRVSGGNNPAHWLFDTARGSPCSLSTNEAGSQLDFWNPGVTFNSNGFNTGGHIQWNTNGVAYASWTFREAPKFFDIVTWSGTGVARDIPHTLGIVPGVIIIKKINAFQNWTVYHRSSGANYNLVLNSNLPAAFNSGIFPRVTSTSFGIDYAGDYNASGSNYIAYLFAHDTAATGLVQCGSYTAQVGSPVPVNLGWQPQFVIIKKATLSENQASENWLMFDSTRGITSTTDQMLLANTTDTESLVEIINLDATGFTISPISYYASNYPQGAQYNYIAIRGST